MSVVSRSVAGSAVAGSVRILGVTAPYSAYSAGGGGACGGGGRLLVFGSYQMSPDQVFRLIFQGEGHGD